MRIRIAGPAPALTIAAFMIAAGGARAQDILIGGPMALGPGLPGIVITDGIGGPSMPVSGPTFPYSYYAALPYPARQYVPYGPTDGFPFYGSPYGRPNDPWSWATLSGAAGAPRRYFYPPVR